MMGEDLSDFIIEDSPTGLPTFDVDKLKVLSPEEFSRRRVEEMEMFLENHKGLPKCLVCFDEIWFAKDLVRYFGGNYHNACFLDIYELERPKLKEHERKYFDLVRDSLIL